MFLPLVDGMKSFPYVVLSCRFLFPLFALGGCALLLSPPLQAKESGSSDSPAKVSGKVSTGKKKTGGKAKHSTAKADEEKSPAAALIEPTREEAVRYLTEHGINLPVEAVCGAQRAALLGDVRMLSFYLAAGVDDVNSVLMYGCGGHYGHETECLRRVLAAGADGNARDASAATPLMYACGSYSNEMYGPPSTVKLLLAAGADVNAKDAQGRTPLWGVCRSYAGVAPEDALLCARLLLKAGADVQAQDNHGDTPLLRAAVVGYGPLMKVLLDAGADASARNKEGKNALMLAAWHNHVEIVKHLLDIGAAGKDDIQAAIGELEQHVAHRNIPEPPCLDVLRAALAADGKTANAPAVSAKSVADKKSGLSAESASQELVKRWYFYAPEEVKTAAGEKAVIAAACHLKTLRLLLAAGAGVNASGPSGETALNRAAGEDGNDACVNALLAAGADVNAAGGTALQSAACAGRTECVRVLLAAGADVNAGDGAALRGAAGAGHLSCVRELLKAGADVNAQSQKGHTALMEASLRGYTDCVKELLAHGADPNAENKDGESALGHACVGGRIPCVKLLLEQKPDVGKLNAAMCAACEIMPQVMYNGRQSKAEFAEIIHLLQEAGADVNAEDKWGQTPMKSLKIDEFKEILRAAGGKE